MLYKIKSPTTATKISSTKDIKKDPVVKSNIKKDPVLKPMTTTQPSGSTSSNDKDLGGHIKEPAVKFDGGPGADFELFKTKLLMIAGGHGVKAHLETDVGAERLASRTEERAKHLLVVSVADNLLRPILKEKTSSKDVSNPLRSI